MIKLKSLIKESLLIESFVNITSTQDKDKYLDIVWNMLQTAYEPIGGFKSSTKESLIRETDMWKLCRRNNNITSLLLYVNKKGHKLIGGATNGTSEGKKDLYKMIDEDIKFKRAWAEVSGAMEHLYIKFNANKIPNTEAEKVLGKHIISLNPDGLHYTRLIAGHPHEKMLVGNIV